MKTFFKSLLALVAVMAVLPAAAQDAAEPIITIHSDAYREVGETNKFSILLGSTQTDYFDIDFGSGLNELIVEPATIDPESGEWKGTWIPCRADADGYIRIYGDASKIDVIVADGGYITDIDMAQCTNLEILSLEHNILRQLDLSAFNKLAAIYLSDNPFTPETPVVIGGNKPALQILEMDIIENISPSFNLSDYPALMSFDGYHSTGITHIDPTGCPNLRVLSLEMTAVSSLDLSQNPELMRLNISETRISDIDLSHNPKLQHFIAGHTSGTINVGYHLNGVDLSHNPELLLLELTNNQLTDIDLSHNTLLIDLNLKGNRLTHIDLSANTMLYSVNLMDNDFTFATLPLPQSTWGEYYYTQHPLPVARSLALGAELDQAANVLRDGTVTSVKVLSNPYGAEPVELDAANYTYADGKIRFNTIPADSVTVYYLNDVFNEYPLFTTPFKVKDASEIGKPSLIASLTVGTSATGPVSFAAGFDKATAAAPVRFLVSLPDGSTAEYSSTFSVDPSEANVTLPAGTTGTVGILVPEGEVLTSLYVDGLPLSGADVKAATELRKLHITGCGLSYIDLRYNRCLTELNLSGNNLSYLDLTGIYGNYEKNVLADINVSRNRLSSMTIVATGVARRLDLSDNLLKEFDLKNFDNIDVLDLSGNQIEGQFSLAYLSEASSIDISDNNITSLLYDSFNRLTTFNVSGNKMDFTTLPLPSSLTAAYTYAPQQPYKIFSQAPAINLSDLAKAADGSATAYVWKKADGTPLVAGTDFEQHNGGFRFLNTELGTIYCEMTNPAFPMLSGENVYTTTPVKVVGAPEKVIATFTTTEDSETGTVVFTGSKSTSLYIDWHGDGTEFIPYAVETSYLSYPAQRTYAGAQVKVYTYDEATDITVFSINDIKMSQFDGSKLTSVVALNINGAGLTDGSFVYPTTETLTEISLSDNNLTAYPFYGRFPKLNSLVLSGNKLTEFDASLIPSLGNLFLSSNEITSVKFNNPLLWNLDMSFNHFSTIDLNGLPSLEQLFLYDNELESIDLTPVKSSLRALAISGNRFTFASLPRLSEIPAVFYYSYAKQAALNVECVDGKVDLSAQAKVGETPTEFAWYLGEASEDPYTGEYTGEALIENDEYRITDGVTTFLAEMPDKVMCVMTNAEFPNLTLLTSLLTAVASIDEVIAEDPDARVNVWNLSGVMLRHDVEVADAVKGLAPGIYIVGNRKVLVK